MYLSKSTKLRLYLSKGQKLGRHLDLANQIGGEFVAHNDFLKIKYLSDEFVQRIR